MAYVLQHVSVLVQLVALCVYCIRLVVGLFGGFLFKQVAVESGICTAIIRAYPKKPYAEGEDTEDQPMKLRSSRKSFILWPFMSCMLRSIAPLYFNSGLSCNTYMVMR